MKVLVIGLGSMGRRRIRNLRALGLMQIVGYDPRPDRRERAAADYGIDARSEWARAAECGASAWIVSTPPITHLHYACEALSRGAHVFTEADLPDPLIHEVIRRRDQTGLVAVPSCTMRHYEGPRRVRDIVQSGTVGRPLLFAYHSGQFLADWHPWERYQDFYVSKRETGAAREIVPFELVWLTWIFGPLHRITGLATRSGTLDADIDDTYALALGFKSGVVGTLVVDVLARPEVRCFRLNGTEGTVEWDQPSLTVRTRRSGDAAWTEQKLDRGSAEVGYLNPEEPYIAELRDFLAAVRAEAVYPFRFEDEVALHRALEHMEQRQPEVLS